MLNCSPAVIHRHNVASTPTLPTSSLYNSSPSPSSLSSSSFSVPSSVSSPQLSSYSLYASTHFKTNPKHKGSKILCSKAEPLKVMISGAPASGKGTQCEMIVQKFGLVHVSTGDLLRAEVSAGTEIGNKAKEYMNSGRLVPDNIVTAMVKTRLSLKDAKEKGWLLDGYPRSFAQAKSLEDLNIRSDVCIMLDVPDEILINRCIGRRLDPVTGRIYHINHFPPENEEIKERLVIRPDDTEEKVKSRLQIYKQNVEAIVSMYVDILHKIDGNCPKEVVFKEIESLLLRVKKEKEETIELGKLAISDGNISKQPGKDNWRGIPTRLNNIPHSREIRKYFYNDVLQATTRAINDGKTRVKTGCPHHHPHVFQKALNILRTMIKIVRSIASSSTSDPERSGHYANDELRGLIDRICIQTIFQSTPRVCGIYYIKFYVEINIPELNPEMDVYRIGTLMELVRTVALSFADDGKRVKVCVQGSMGEGALAGMPLQLAGTRKILEFMDWGDYDAMDTFIKIGSIGAKDVDEQDDMFILVAPQNAVGNCIIDDLRAMTNAAGRRPVILVNPRLKDLPSSSGIMQTMGREERMAYAASFEICYFFRLLYYAGTQYPIMGALRMPYPYNYELFKRVDEAPGKEKYVMLKSFPERPTSEEINDAFEGKDRSRSKRASGFWALFSGLLS